MSVKRFAPPPAKKGAGRGAYGRGRWLSLLAYRGPDGKAEPYRIQDGKPLWKFILRIRGDGGSRCKTILAKDWKDAERLAMLTEVELLNPTKEKAAPDARTVADLCDHFLAVRRAPNSRTREATVRTYARDLDRFVRESVLSSMPVVAVTPKDVDTWKAALVDGQGKARTRERRVNLLASLFHLAVSDGWRAASPVLGRHREWVGKIGERAGKLEGDQRVARVLSREQLADVVGKLDRQDPALRLLVELAGGIGPRLREATHLLAQGVRFELDGSAFVAVGSGHACACRDCGGTRLTKAGKPRIVPVPPDLVEDLRVYLEERRAKFGPGGWLFPCWRARARQRTKPGELRVAKTVEAGFAAACKAAGLVYGRECGVVFHDLRSTAKTNLLLDGANPTAVDVALGHELPGMSAVYVSLRDQPALLYRGVYPAWEPRLAVVKEAKSA